MGYEPLYSFLAAIIRIYPILQTSQLIDKKTPG
jgi:hypothetical protein